MLDRGGWGNIGKDRAGISGQILAIENTSVLAFPQILHSSWAMDAQLLHGFGRATASTATPSGWHGSHITHRDCKLHPSVLAQWDGGKWDIQDSVGPSHYWKIWQLGHTRLKQRSLLKPSPWSHFFHYLRISFYKKFMDHGLYGNIYATTSSVEGKKQCADSFLKWHCVHCLHGCLPHPHFIVVSQTVWAVVNWKSNRIVVKIKTEKSANKHLFRCCF